MATPDTPHSSDQPGAVATDARAREAALLEILQVISASRGDEVPVFEVILRNAAKLCDAPLAMLALVNDARTQLSYVTHWGTALKIFQPGVTVWQLDSPIVMCRAVQDAKVVHVEDMADDDLYRDGDPTRVRIVDVEGVRTLLAVPLIVNGKAIGCIGLHRSEVRPFEDNEIALIETFAQQAVIAIENVGQFKELQTRSEREEATREILQVTSRSRADEMPVLDVIVRNAARLCNATLAGVSMVNEARTQLHYACISGDDRGVFRIGYGFDLFGPLQVAVSTREGRIIHTPDLKDDPLFDAGDPDRVKVVEQAGVRTFLTVPLMKDGVALGCLNLNRFEVKPFDDADIALVETFAEQAVIAIENVRQFRELQTRLERERASKDILDVISRSRTDTAPVFEVILRNAARLCGAPMAGLNILNENRSQLTMMAHWGAPLKHLVVGETTWPMDSDLVLAKATRDCRVIQVADLSEDELYRSGDPDRVAAVDGEGARTFLAVPLVRQGEAIGCIGLYRREVAPFSDDEIDLIKTFAAQAVIAIENARQFRELQTRLAREAATNNILRVISQARDDENPVFDAILESASSLCGAASASLMLVNPAHTHTQFRRRFGRHFRKDTEDQSWPIDAGYAQTEAVRTGAVVHEPDLRESALYLNGDPVRTALVDEYGARSALAVPMLHADRAIGVIVLHRIDETRAFSDNDIRLVESFAAQAVIAINNVKQFKALEQLNAELGDRVTEQVDELERMGRLKRFLSPQVADAVVSSGDDNLLGSHRAMIAILFCDIRGFTAFCESAEPEETIEVLQTFHETLGRLIHAAGAGFDHRAGDGIMVVFNDPVPCDDPVGAALRVAVQMRQCMVEICTKWRKLGHRMGFGVGISLGYATVGMVGFEGRYDYTASGSAVNLAARLCDHAADQEILLSPRAATALEGVAQIEAAGELTLKGFHSPVDVFRVSEVKETQ